MKWLEVCTSQVDGVLHAKEFDNFHDAWKSLLDNVANDISDKAPGEEKVAERAEYDLGEGMAVKSDGEVVFMYQVFPVD